MNGSKNNGGANDFIPKGKKLDIDEEKDFFLTYINKHLESIDKDLSVINKKEKEGKVDPDRKFDYLRMKVSLNESKAKFEEMKEHYCRAFATKKRFNNGKYFFFDSLSESSSGGRFFDRSDVFSLGSGEKRCYGDIFQNRLAPSGKESPHSVVREKGIVKSLLNLIFVSKFVKKIQRKDEFLSIFSNLNITFSQLDEIPRFYDNIFSFSSESFSTVEAKLLCSLHMLEIFLNESHPLHIHFHEMKTRVEQISSLDIFLKKPLSKDDEEIPNRNINNNNNSSNSNNNGNKPDGRLSQNRYFEDLGRAPREKNPNDFSDNDIHFEREKGEGGRAGGLLFQRFHSELEGSENFDSSFHKHENSGSDDAKKVIRKKLLRKKQSFENYYDGDSEKSFHQREEVKEEENEDDEMNEKAKSEGESDYVKEEGLERKKKPRPFGDISKRKKDKKKGKNFRINFVDSGGSASEMQDDYKYKINHKPNALQGAGVLKESHKDFDTDKDMKL